MALPENILRKNVKNLIQYAGELFKYRIGNLSIQYGFNKSN